MEDALTMLGCKPLATFDERMRAVHVIWNLRWQVEGDIPHHSSVSSSYFLRKSLPLLSSCLKIKFFCLTFEGRPSSGGSGGMIRPPNTQQALVVKIAACCNVL